VSQENFAHGIEGIHKNAVSGAVGLPLNQQLQILVYCEFFNPVGKSFLTHHQVMQYIL